MNHEEREELKEVNSHYYRKEAIKLLMKSVPFKKP
jgi:hypothetical protein